MWVIKGEKLFPFKEQLKERTGQQGKEVLGWSEGLIQVHKIYVRLSQDETRTSPHCFSQYNI